MSTGQSLAGAWGRCRFGAVPLGVVLLCRFLMGLDVRRALFFG